MKLNLKTKKKTWKSLHEGKSNLNYGASQRLFWEKFLFQCCFHCFFALSLLSFPLASSLSFKKNSWICLLPLLSSQSLFVATSNMTLPKKIIIVYFLLGQWICQLPSHCFLRRCQIPLNELCLKHTWF